MPLNTTENWHFQLWVKYILFGFQTSTEYEYEYYSDLGNHANTNTNSIQFWKIIRIRIRIISGLKISAEYEYEYHYSVSTIRILFEYYSNTELFAHLWLIPSFSHWHTTFEEPLIKYHIKCKCKLVYEFDRGACMETSVEDGENKTIGEDCFNLLPAA